jgi:uncharacterized delta-60 repeat protein
MRARGGIAGVCVLALLVCAAAALAAPGSLDKSFGDNGRAFAPFAEGDASANAVALDRKGRIVTAGQIYVAGGEENFAVARFKPGGVLDDSFSGDGEKMLDFGVGDDEAHGVAVDRKGRILVAGGADPGTGPDFGIARFKPNGALDPDFGEGGVALVPIRAGADNANAMMLDSKGRILVAGDSQGATQFDFALARLKPNGKPDTSFGGDGKVTTPMGGDSFVNSVATDKDGRIVALGAAFNASGEDFALARYKPNGKLDHSFSDDGRVKTKILAANDTGRSVAIDGRGRIVAAGDAENGSDPDFAVARYKPNGKLDHSFGGDGKVTTKLVTTDIAFGAAVDSANRIVAAGLTGSATEEFGLVRYRPDGKLDPKFAHNGRAEIGFGDAGAAGSVAIDRKDRIVAAGGGVIGSEEGIALIRLQG